MYKQVQSVGNPQAKAQAAQKAVTSAEAFVKEMIRNKEAELMQSQFAVDTVSDMIGKNFSVDAPNNPFNVGHRDTFTVRREIGFSATLNEVANKPDLLHWKGMSAPVKLPEGARAILLSSVVKQTQNSAPIGYNVQIKNHETNSKWTSGSNVDGDLFLKPFMTNPLNCDWSLFTRQNVETFDVQSLEGWDKITEESIRSCILKEHTDQRLTEIVHPSILTQLILMKMPSISQEYFAIAKVGVDDVTGEPIQIAYVNSDLSSASLNLALNLNKQVAFSDPNKIEVVFTRADGQAINSLQGLIDASPDTGAFQEANVANQIYHTSITLEQNYLLWFPSAASV